MPIAPCVAFPFPRPEHVSTITLIAVGVPGMSVPVCQLTDAAAGGIMCQLSVKRTNGGLTYKAMSGTEGVVF